MRGRGMRDEGERGEERWSEEKEEMEEMVRDEQQKVQLKSGSFGGLFTISSTYNLFVSSRGNLILEPRFPPPSGGLQGGGWVRD